jgi:arginine repressor
MSKISEVVQNDPLLTQKGIRLSLESEGLAITQSAISQNLKKLDITRKRVRKVYNKVTDSRIIQERKQYAIKYRNVQNSKPLFLD